MQFQLTADQQNAAHEFAMFMASPASEFSISGPAGVGKTTLLKYLKDGKDHIKVAQLLGRPALTKWAFTATTNKAAEVLSGALGEDAQTIHSFLGLKVYNDYATGKTKISRSRNSEVREDMLIVIDECSMVDRQLLKYIEECTINCKILYVGDHCQMAPVLEETSPVFDRTVPAVLKQIVRSQHTPDITALANQLRETVETGVFKPIVGVPGVIDYLDPQEAEAEIYDNFVANQTDSRILVYTNRAAIGFNNWVRTASNLPPTFVAGERVVSCGAFHFRDKNGMTRVEQELEVLSVSDPYEDVTQIGKVMYSMTCYDVRTNGGDLQVSLEPDKLQHLIKMTAKDANWSAHFQLKESFADLRPRHACTVYKAQGSTYHTVFVHLSDIGSCTNAAQAARMLYVACSRPTHRICLIGQLPARFSGE